MPITINGNNVNVVIFNNSQVDAVTVNGNQVFPDGPSYPPYLTFSSASAFTLDAMAVVAVNPVPWDGIIEYSTDAETWTTWDGTTVNSASDNGTHKLYLRGSGNTVVSGGQEKGIYLGGSGISCDGDIRVLLDYSDPENATMGTACFSYLFESNTALAKAPDLPATVLSMRCYQSMFANCTSLVESPALPATTLAVGCFIGMFLNCTSLESIPALHALEYPASCCAQMFMDCSLVKISETQTGEYQTAYRIPAEGAGTVSGVAQFGNMIQNTGGTFTSTPTINTTYYTSNTIVG